MSSILGYDGCKGLLHEMSYPHRIADSSAIKPHLPRLMIRCKTYIVASCAMNAKEAPFCMFSTEAVSAFAKVSMEKRFPMGRNMDQRETAEESHLRH